MVGKIGNGQLVQVKEDKWILVKTSRAIISPFPTDSYKTKVSALINPKLGIWKSDMVERFFLPHEANLILGIPLSKKLTPNRIIWGLMPSGMFLTSSVHKMLVACDVTNIAGSSSLVPQNQFWKGLWQSRVPNKVKHFARHVCHNALPTITNLYQHHINSSDICESYNDQPEDTLHALWLCKEVECVWNSIS